MKHGTADGSFRTHGRDRVFYAGCFLAAFVTTVLPVGSRNAPAESPPAWVGPGENLTAWLDERFDGLWQQEGVAPEPCDDATFARRVHLDLIGRIPSVSETRDFLADTAAYKHARLVDRLLLGREESGRNTELHAEHFARIWRRIMIPPGTTAAPMAAQFEPWLENQFRENVGYDELARRVITAQGQDAQPVNALYQAVGGSPDAYATAFPRIFLGVRLGCAQCHDHPFAAWKQKDFWGMAAFFSGARPANAPNAEQTPAEPGTITFEGVEYTARVLWSGAEDSTEVRGNPRRSLAEWLTSAENPNFAATAVNRTWQHLLGQGLVPDVDDLDLVSAEERARVLDPLAAKFAESGFDVRWLVAGICKSRAYRCASVKPGETVASPLSGVRPLKTLTPEQLFDSLEQALMLPVSQTAADAARHNGLRQQLISRFDESAGHSPEDYVAGVPQVLMLMNGKLIADATSLDTSRTLRAVVDAPFLDEADKIDTLYLAALTRRPTEREKSALREHLQSQPDEARRRQAYAEIFWALLNSPEFVLCR